MTTESEKTVEQPPQQPPPVADAKPHVLASSIPEDALKARLEQAKSTGRNDLLKELGVSDLAQLKGALDSIKAQEEASKSTADKLAELAKREQDAMVKLEAYRQAVDSVWQNESAALTPEQTAAIVALAGDDTAARVRALNALRSTWQVAKQSSVPAQPANTAPAPNAPPPTVTSPPDLRSQYDQIKQSNPVLAAMFLERHRGAIFPQ